MKSIPHAISIAALLTGSAFAQYEGEIEIPDNVLEAIREFNERAPGTPNEVAVVLDPPEPEEPEKETTDKEEEVDDVVAAILADEPDETEPAGDENVEAVEEPAPHGPEVRVQALTDTGGAKIEASDVTISAPFAAKPLGRPPVGWKLVSSPDAPEFTENVEVSPGTMLTLSIRPHILIPEADGRDVFQIVEPGFDPALGYRQEATVSSAIASSIRQLEEDARVLGKAIDDLEQILISLPKPDNVSANDTENSQ